MNIFANHIYDIWATPPCQESGITEYFKLQKLIREKYVENIQLEDRKDKGQDKNDSEKKKAIQEKYQNILSKRCNHSLLLSVGKPDFKFLPENSWFLQLQFELATPLICKDDETFYIHDNPFHKDKVFKEPFYPASAWKGRLRWMTYKQWVDQDGSAQSRFELSLLFGDETGEEENQKLAAYLNQAHPETKEEYRLLLRKIFQLENVKSEKDGETETLPHHAGWLHFYPSFFEKMDLEVINPHDRKTNVGKNPIMIETVPLGETGTFYLLFAPTGVTASKCSTEMMTRQLNLIISALDGLFRVYGFGAKTSSGFGAVSAIKGGHLTVKNSWLQQKKEDQIKPKDEYMKYLDENSKIRPEYCGTGEGGLLSNNEYKNYIAGKADSDSLSVFKKFRYWYIEYGEDYQKQLSSGQELFPRWDVKNFDELLALPQKVEKDFGLSKGGDGCNVYGSARVK